MGLSASFCGQGFAETQPLGRKVFATTVQRAFDTNHCQRCHPQDAASDATMIMNGGKSIYRYDDMRTLLLKQILIPKLQHRIPHMGGAVCSHDLSRSPCREVLLWYRTEAKEAHPDVLPCGMALPLTADGHLQGWAINRLAPQEPAVVVISYHPDPNAATPAETIATISASEESFDNGYSGQHGFSYQWDLTARPTGRIFVQCREGAHSPPLAGTPLVLTPQ